MKKSSIKLLTVFMLLAGLLLLPAVASATHVTLHVPVELKDIPADLAPIGLSFTVYDKNKTYVTGGRMPLSMTSGPNGLSLTGTPVLDFNANNIAYYRVYLVSGDSPVPLDQALQQKGALIVGTPAYDSGILPLNP